MDNELLFIVNLIKTWFLVIFYEKKSQSFTFKNTKWEKWKMLEVILPTPSKMKLSTPRWFSSRICKVKTDKLRYSLIWTTWKTVYKMRVTSLRFGTLWLTEKCFPKRNSTVKFRRHIGRIADISFELYWIFCRVEKVLCHKVLAGWQYRLQ